MDFMNWHMLSLVRLGIGVTILVGVIVVIVRLRIVHKRVEALRTANIVPADNAGAVLEKIETTHSESMRAVNEINRRTMSAIEATRRNVSTNHDELDDELRSIRNSSNWLMEKFERFLSLSKDETPPPKLIGRKVDLKSVPGKDDQP